MSGKAIRARGIVQGVGFRPTVWRLARQFNLTGSVWNDGEGVMIHAYGRLTDLDALIATIPLQLPPLARLDALEVSPLNDTALPTEFSIIASQAGIAETAVAADAATCPDCLADIFNPDNRRYRYPFTNCTHCGPRLSIVRQVPYDRCYTSMAAFAQCTNCQREYNNPGDRRFHAQANCCPVCGPRLWLQAANGNRVTTTDPIQRTAELLSQGYILAIKGLGGFHLACNAADNTAVTRLRQCKQRYAKPFALMARDLEMVRRHTKIETLELQALQDKAAPIVLLPIAGIPLAEAVAPGDNKLGFMLPYTPLHTLLMQALDMPIVLTSGNISDEPQCIDNDEACSKLAGIADFLLLHDREIVNRLDDSVVRLMDGQMRILRRGRGYCPEALLLPIGFQQASPVLAMGAELKNSFCVLKHGQAVVSQYIGDLENAAVQQDYRRSITLYQQLYDCYLPEHIAVDSHDGYLSSQYGLQLATTKNLNLVKVQHHHAHLAACLAEQGVPPDTAPVLAAIFDGLGLGEDRQLWGGEFLLGNYRSCNRLGYLQPIALLGGTQAIREPWRNTYAHLRQYFDWQSLQKNYAELEIITLLNSKPLATLDTMLSKQLNSPLSSSCGRWFDAFAAALGLHAERINYEGQAAIAMEILAEPQFAHEHAYPEAYAITKQGDTEILGWQPLWQAVLDDLKNNTDTAKIAARIHQSLAAATVNMLAQLSVQTGINIIVLSGGVFQNRLILEAVASSLRNRGKTVLTPTQYPVNDGGLALGQAVIAAINRVK